MPFGQLRERVQEQGRSQPPHAHHKSACDARAEVPRVWVAHTARGLIPAALQGEGARGVSGRVPRGYEDR